MGLVWLNRRKLLFFFKGKTTSISSSKGRRLIINLMKLINKINLIKVKNLINLVNKIDLINLINTLKRVDSRNNFKGLGAKLAPPPQNVYGLRFKV